QLVPNRVWFPVRAQEPPQIRPRGVSRDAGGAVRAPGGRVTVDPAGRVTVSVVMVLYGGGKLARRSLQALAENTEAPYELVLVDNASPDEALGEIGDLAKDAKVIHNETNLGFGGASNQGAERAGAETLCFLNSDALVEPGWLEPLLETLAEPGVGAVVPMLLNP